MTFAKRYRYKRRVVEKWLGFQMLIVDSLHEVEHSRWCPALNAFR